MIALIFSLEQNQKHSRLKTELKLPFEEREERERGFDVFFAVH